MPNNRKELIKKLIKEGFTHRTLSLFSGPQLVELGKKIFIREAITDEEADTMKQSLSDYYKEKAISVVAQEDKDIEKVTPHNEPVIKIEKDGKEMKLTVKSREMSQPCYLVGHTGIPDDFLHSLVVPVVYQEKFKNPIAPSMLSRNGGSARLYDWVNGKF